MKCTICKDVMLLMKEILMDDRIDRRLGDDLEKLCKYLPQRVSEKHRIQVEYG